MSTRIYKWFMFSLVATLIVFAVVGCSEENPVGTDPINADLVLAQVIDNQTYISPISGIDDDKAGTDLSRATQEEFGFPAAFMNGDDLYVGPLSMGGTGVVKYTRDNNGVVSESARMPMSASAWVSGMAFESSAKAYLSSYNEQQIVVFNPSTMTEIRRISVAEYSSRDDVLAMPAQMVLRDGKLFVCMHQMADQNNIDTVMTMLVVNTERDSVEKMILDTRASFAGAREGFPNIMIDDNDDIYVNGLAMFGMSTAPGVRAGILRINSGETDFDKDYFFGPSTATIDNVDMPTAFYGLVYAGGSKAYGFVCDMANWGEDDDMTTARVFEAAMFDLVAKTVTMLPLPATDGYAHNVCLYEEKVLYCLQPKSDKKGIYIYDPVDNLAEISSPAIATAGFPVFIGAFEQ